MKFYRTILSFLVLIVFLLPATGFYYIRHSCLNSGHEQIVFSDMFECHSSGIKDNINCESCTDCCINELHYFKDDSQYTPPVKELVKITVSKIAFINYQVTSLFTVVSYRQQKFESTSELSAVEILRLTGKLLL